MKPNDELKAYLDGELSPEQADLVRQALLSDPHLRQELDEYKKIGEAIQASYSPATPKDTAGMEKAVAAMGRGTAARPSARPGARFAPLAPSKLAYTLGGIAAGTAILAAIGFLATGGLRDSSGRTGMVTTSPNVEMAAGYDSVGDQAQSAVRDAQADSLAGPGTDNVPSAEEFVEKGGSLIAKDGMLALSVENVGSVMAQVEAVAGDFKGYVEKSDQSSTGAYNSGLVQIRVPSASFEKAMSELRGLGEVVRESSEGTDVTGAFVDAGARLKTLRAEEEQYINMISSTRNVDEMIKVRTKLSDVRYQIESLTAQQKQIASRGMMSTITVEISAFVAPMPRPVSTNWFSDSWFGAVSGLASFARSMGSGAIYLIVYSPVWVPILLFAYFTWRRRSSRSVA